MSTAIAVLTCIAALQVGLLVSAQLNRCNSDTKSSCVSRTEFRVCVADASGVLQPSGVTYDCGTIGPVAGPGDRNTVCFASGTSVSSTCNFPPPDCTSIGSFAITGRAQDYYTCSSSGNGGLTQTLGGCLSNTQFNIATGTCTVPSTVTTTTPAPTCLGWARQEDPSSCSKFFQCILPGRARVSVTCPFNKFYNTALRICKFTANCGARPRN